MSTINKTPQNGILIFAGNDEFHIIEPPLPVKRNFYRCDNKFHIDEFLELFQTHNKYLVLLVGAKKYQLYRKNGTEYRKLDSDDITLQTDSARGGFSANRFQRNRKIQRNNNCLGIAEMISDHVRQENMDLIMIGYSDFFNDVLNYINHNTNINIIEHKVMDISSIPNINELNKDIELMILKYENIAEYTYITSVLNDIPRNPDLYTFGYEETINADNDHTLKTVIVSGDCKHIWNTNNVHKITKLLNYDVIGILYYCSSV